MLRRLLSVLCLSLSVALAACGSGPEDGSTAADWRGLAAEAAENRAWIEDRELLAKSLHARLRDLLSAVPQENPKFPTFVDLYDRLTTEEDKLAAAIAIYDPVLERIWTARGFPGIDSARTALATAFAPAYQTGLRIDKINDDLKALRTE